MKNWITLTDSSNKQVRINVENIAYYRDDGEGHTTVCLGGVAKDKLTIVVKEPPEVIDLRITDSRR